MVRRIRSDSVLALGKKIVDELGLDQSVDTLGRWMAHDLAEKMKDAEAATGGAREQKISECSDAILKLWAHLDSENPDDSARAKIEDLLKRLEVFTDFSHTLASHLRGKLEQAAH